MGLSDQNYVSLSRKGSEAELVQSIVDRIGYNRNIPVCVVSKEKHPKDRTRIYADKRAQHKQTFDRNGESKNLFGFGGNKGNKNGAQSNKNNNVIVIYDPTKYTPGLGAQRSARSVDGPNYRIESEFFESYPPNSPIEYVTTQKDQTVVRCVLIRKTGDPYPLQVKPAHTFVSENSEEEQEEPEEEEEEEVRPTIQRYSKGDPAKPLRTYVLVRPEGYDEFEDFSVEPLSDFE